MNGEEQKGIEKCRGSNEIPTSFMHVSSVATSVVTVPLILIENHGKKTNLIH